MERILFCLSFTLLEKMQECALKVKLKIEIIGMNIVLHILFNLFTALIR